MKKLYSLMLIVFINTSTYARLYINEFLASNDNTLADNYGEYDDWIEIYNDGDTLVNLIGFYLTDNLNNPTKWALPAVTVPAKGFVLVWADKDSLQGELHASFKLSSYGEEIGLYNGFTFIDSLVYDEQVTDISYGRYPDGSCEWTFLKEPTPGAPNSNSSINFTEEPQFSISSGFYQTSIYVEITTASPDAKIYYTTDCSDPTNQSFLYTEPIFINKTSVIRARAYKCGYEPSKIVSQSYFFDEDFDIGAISLITDPKNLWDPDSGIYANPMETGDSWERPATIILFESDGSPEFCANVGIRIHGGWSRRTAKKGFRCYFRSEYGQSWLKYQLFPSKDLTEFKRFVLHAGFEESPSNGTADAGTLLRDVLMHALGKRLNPELALVSRPLALFLNGEPWGIYNAIERIDKYFIETNFGMSACDIISHYGKVMEGSGDRWNEMISFFEKNNIEQPQNYEIAQSYIDIPNFTLYHILNIYGANLDWPHFNNIAYCGYKPGDKWKWLLWDMDKAFLFTSDNTLRKATSEDREGTIILRKLLENDDYKHYFANLFADILNKIFVPDKIDFVIDSLATIIRNDIHFETDRWGGTVEKWEENVGRLHSFAHNRSEVVFKNIKNELELKGIITLNIALPVGGIGTVRVNSCFIDSFPWQGTYFKEIPIELEALPAIGYRFKEWCTSTIIADNPISLNLTSDFSIYPVFEVDSTTIGDEIVINEINYHSDSAFNPRDWVELHNYSREDIDVSGWHFKDSNDEHDFLLPPNTVIEAQGFFVLCRDSSAFSGLFPEVKNFCGDFDFGLSSKGELLRLYNATGDLIDSLTYGVSFPWPSAPNGNGPTLQLIDPLLDNALPDNWQASENFGNPGRNNNEHSSVIIVAEPDTLFFTAIAGGQSPATQLIKVTAADSSMFMWTATETPATSWLLLENTTGIAGEHVKVIVDISTLPAGSYEAGVCIYANDDSVLVPVQLKITQAPFYAMFRAVNSNSLPNPGWAITTYLGDSCLMAKCSCFEKPDETCKLNFSFETPEGMDKVYIFAEVAMANEGERGAFWVSFNNTDLCNWQTKVTSSTAWQRNWVSNTAEDSIHAFQVQTGENVVSLYPYNQGALIHWLVVTDNPAEDIASFEFPLPTKVDNTTISSKTLPGAFRLNQNNPNPFNSETIISFELPVNSDVHITIYNTLGQQVYNLVKYSYLAGKHTISWNGVDNSGLLVKSGIYFAVMQASHYRRAIKMTLLR